MRTKTVAEARSCPQGPRSHILLSRAFMRLCDASGSHKREPDGRRREGAGWRWREGGLPSPPHVASDNCFGDTPRGATTFKTWPSCRTRTSQTQEDRSQWHRGLHTGQNPRLGRVQKAPPRAPPPPAPRPPDLLGFLLNRPSFQSYHAVTTPTPPPTSPSTVLLYHGGRPARLWPGSRADRDIRDPFPQGATPVPARAPSAAELPGTAVTGDVKSRLGTRGE